MVYIMAKVITTIVAEGLDFDDICSFVTKNCIGIYSHNLNTFVLMQKSSHEFRCSILPVCSNLKELDGVVYSLSDEHIEEVYESNTYEFILEIDD